MISKNFVYTGIGSRETPDQILNDMAKIARYLAKKGYTLRSGGAKGADKAFENNALKTEIYYANDANEECMKIAKRIHPNWDAMGDFGKKLHARNIKQVLGNNLDTKSDFLICWTLDGKKIGGTRTAIVCAEENNIPVFNLAIKKDRIDLVTLLNSL